MRAKQICEALARLEREGVAFGEILSQAVEMIHESNPRFDWTGIYELFDHDVLRLGPFIGDPTDHCFIAVGHGVCGTAVAERRNINVPDVSQLRNYLACSDATRSELVVLIRDGDHIFGQIDIDSHEFDAFDDPGVQLVEEVAAWLSGIYARRDSRVAVGSMAP